MELKCQQKTKCNVHEIGSKYTYIFLFKNKLFIQKLCSEPGSTKGKNLCKP